LKLASRLAMTGTAMRDVVDALRRLAPHAAIVMASVALGIAVSLLLEAAAGMAMSLWLTGTTSWWVGTDVLGPHSAIAWQSAIVLSGVFAWLAAPIRRGIHASARRVIAAIVLATFTQIPSLADWIEEHESQAFPRFRLELAAANDRDDTLVISDADVERVRWIDAGEDSRPGISIRFDAATADAVRERSIRRVGELDAIVVDGEVELVPRIHGVLLDGTLALHVPPDDRGRLVELYTRLTGRAAPSR
jgi:hypothetical protein